MTVAIGPVQDAITTLAAEGKIGPGLRDLLYVLLEELREARNGVGRQITMTEIERLKAEVTELKSPKTEFAAWLERVHPEMIESVVLTFSKKEN